ncbi:MAG: VCBS repeat-containing protein [Phycisphaerales bacterium]
MNARLLLTSSPILILACAGAAQDCTGPDLFAAPEAYAAGGGARELDLGDLDGDGALDAVVGSSGTGLWILPGNGDGTLGASIEPQPRLGGGDATIFDMNGDGMPDIVSLTRDAVAVLLNRGGLQFEPAALYDAGISPVALDIADVNNDGAPDVVSIGFSGRITVFLNDGGGALATATVLETDIALSDVAVGDLDHDGNADIYATQIDPMAFEDVFYTGRGDGQFDAVDIPGEWSLTDGVRITDLNGDGRNDLLLAVRVQDSTVTRALMAFYTWDGTSFRSLLAAQNLGLGASARSPSAADFDGDGLVDVFAALPGRNQVQVLPGLRAAPLVFAAPIVLDTGPATSDVGSGDLNGDGRPDLVVANWFPGGVGVLLNRCAPPCQADLDGDGELTIFDFLSYQNLFDAGDPAADFDGEGALTIFDFLAFQNAFDAGC